MNKVLILVYVPKLEEEYDILIPINKKIGLLKNFIADTIYELSGEKLDDVDNLVLYDKDSGKRLINDVYVKDSGITNGTKILLV